MPIPSASQNADVRRAATPEDVARTVDFLLIGAQKAGTTWISEALRRHEDVFVPKEKELHFFNMNHNFEKGFSWYLKFFEGSETKSAVGECTPNYLYNVCLPSEARDFIHRDVPRRVKRVLPDVKLLVSLRDPVDRAISGYFHFVTRGDIRPNQKLRDVLDRRGIVSIGRYDKQMELWLQEYDLDRMKIVIYEEDIRPDDKKMATLNSIFQHLGVAPKENIPEIYKKSNYKRSDLTAHLAQFSWFRDTHVGRRLSDRIDRLAPRFVQDLLKIKVDPEDVSALQEVFEPHNRALEQMIGRRLPWRGA